MRVGEHQRLVAEVVLDYSFAVGAATAWIPSLRVFCLQTALHKRDVISVLQELETYGILGIESAPQKRFAYARRYTFFPRRLQPWAVTPRLKSRELQAKASQVDRWLSELNANGGPEQGDLFPELWNFADSLAEWGVDIATQAVSAMHAQGVDSATREVSAEHARHSPVRQPAHRGHVEPETPDASSSHVPGAGGESPPVVNRHRSSGGESPPPLHERVHGLNEIHGTDLMYPNPIHVGSGGESPPPGEEAEFEDESRPAHWPARDIENRLIREIAQMCLRFYGQEGGAKKMAEFGGLWRWRVRNYCFAVSTAVEKTAMQWSEVKKLGGFLNREFVKVQRAINAKREAELNAADEEER